MNNKRFLIGAVVLLVVVGFGITMFGPKKETPKESASRVSSDQLIKFHNAVKGSPNAAVTMVEFLDPECEACRMMHPIVSRLLKEYDGKLRVVIRYMPYHQNSMFAATALEEAKEHGKYDEALDVLFDKQPEWGDHHNPQPGLIVGYLEKLGVPKESLNAEALLKKHGSKVDDDKKDGEALGVQGTPTFFVNGKKLSQIGYEPLKAAIEEELQAQ